jgi:hypothetical protein
VGEPVQLILDRIRQVEAFGQRRDGVLAALGNDHVGEDEAAVRPKNPRDAAKEICLPGAVEVVNGQA